MFSLLILFGIIFLIAIVVLLIRIQGLIGIVKGKKKEVTDTDEIVNRSNRTNAILLLVFMIAGITIAILFSFGNFSEYFIPIASEHGITTDNLFWITTGITGFVFLLTNILLFYFSYKYRYKKEKKALFYPDNIKLEIAWTLVPAIVLTALVIGGLQTWGSIMGEPPQDSEVVEILGYQFAWRSRYPGLDGELGAHDFRLITPVNEFGLDLSDPASFDDFIPREMYLPVNRPVLLRIRSRDVIHSVFAPHFRLKMDAVPGMTTRFWFIPNKTTAEMRRELNNPDFNYEIACAEICGRGHFSMRMVVVVVEEEEYQNWYLQQRSFLSMNPDLMSQVPENLREQAYSVTGLSPQAATQAVEVDQAEEGNME
jgi:cytochrome c oxidase subunit II